MATVALYMEFGTVDTPARSFIRGALFQYRERIERFIAETLAKFIGTKGMQATTALAAIGRFVASLVKVRINTSGLWAAPNAPRTIKAKGFNRPLHNTEQLAKSISWAVRAGANGPILLEGPAR